MSTDNHEEPQEEPSELYEPNAYGHAANLSDEISKLTNDTIHYYEPGGVDAIFELEDDQTLQKDVPLALRAEDKLVMSSSVEFDDIPTFIYMNETLELRFKRTITVDNKSDKRVKVGVRTIVKITPTYHTKIVDLQGWGWFPAKTKSPLKFKGNKIKFFGMGPGRYRLEVKIEMRGLIDEHDNTWPEAFNDLPNAAKSHEWDVMPSLALS